MTRCRRALFWAGLAIALVVVAALWPVTPGVPADRPIGPVATGQDSIGDPGVGIVVLGTSLSHGDWPHVMGRALESCGVNPGEVRQITKPGAPSDWGLGQLEAVIAAKPALVLMEFAINDADLRDGLSLKESRKTHLEITDRLQSALPEARLAWMTMSPATGLRRLTRPFLGRFYTMVGEVAAERETGFIDLYPRWQEALAEGVTLPDGLHPAPEDVNSIALPVIVEAVAEAFGQSCEM